MSNEYVLSEHEKQFVAQYNRLWAPVYERLRVLVDGYVCQGDSPESMLLQLQAVTESALQQAIDGRKVAEMELMQEVWQIVNRRGLTWERVQELVERAG